MGSLWMGAGIFEIGWDKRMGEVRRTIRAPSHPLVSRAGKRAQANQLVASAEERQSDLVVRQLFEGG